MCVTELRINFHFSVADVTRLVTLPEVCDYQPYSVVLKSNMIWADKKTKTVSGEISAFPSSCYMIWFYDSDMISLY